MSHQFITNEDRLLTDVTNCIIPRYKVQKVADAELKGISDGNNISVMGFCEI